MPEPTPNANPHKTTHLSAGVELQAALERLRDATTPIRSMNMMPFSDLHRAHTDLFFQAWRTLDSARRLELARELVEQAEVNIQLNFWAILRLLLRDADPGVRRLAIDGLWEDERPSLLDPLIAALVDDPVAEVRSAAAGSLGRFVRMGVLDEISPERASRAELALQDAWQRANEDIDVRRRALEGLACTGRAAVLEMIDIAYCDENRSMRQSALYAMGQTADKRWGKYVLAELRSEEAAMRFEAATAAGELALSAALLPLVALLDDPDSHVREAAALALGEIGGAEARRALEAHLDSEDERLAHAADEALQVLLFYSDGSTGTGLPGRAQLPADAGARRRTGDSDEGFDNNSWLESDDDDDDDDDNYDDDDDLDDDGFDRSGSHAFGDDDEYDEFFESASGDDERYLI